MLCIKRFASRWTAAEDARLATRFASVGPAWTVLALGVPSRSPVECRRRVLALSGQVPPPKSTLPPRIAFAARKAYESLSHELHGTRLLRIPAERVLPDPATMLAATAAAVARRTRVVFGRERRARGWDEAEVLAVRQAYEQYGPAWTRIAGMLRWRSAGQCRALMFRQSVGLIRSRLGAIGPSNDPGAVSSAVPVSWTLPVSPPPPLTRSDLKARRYAYGSEWSIPNR